MNGRAPHKVFDNIPNIYSMSLLRFAKSETSEIFSPETSVAGNTNNIGLCFFKVFSKTNKIPLPFLHFA